MDTRQDARKRRTTPNPAHGFRLRGGWLRRASVALCVGLLAVAPVSGGCDKKKVGDEDKPIGPMPETHSTGERHAVEQPCEKAEEVVTPEPKSLEETVQNVLRAATSEGDDNERFEAFYAQFKTTTSKSNVKSFYWKNAKKHAKKLLIPGREKDVAFTICRRLPGGGAGKTKVFLRSYDANKQNTPMTLIKIEDGSYKVTAYSP